MSHKGKRGIGARDNSREGGRRDGYSRQERKKEEVGVLNGWEGREIGEIMQQWLIFRNQKTPKGRRAKKGRGAGKAR